MERQCEICKAVFKCRRKSSRFCSVNCRGTWNKGTNFGGGRKKTEKVQICLVCNKNFDTRGTTISKYCSRECWSKRNPPILNECLFCGKEFWDYKSNSKIYCTKRCYSLHMRELKKGENSSFWRGGVTKQNQLERCKIEYKEWRQKVFIRDGFTCQKCGIRSGNGQKIYLHAHHIKEFADFPELRLDIDNGMTLCKDCHLLEHHHKF